MYTLIMVVQLFSAIQTVTIQGLSVEECASLLVENVTLIEGSVIVAECSLSRGKVRYEM